MFDRITEKLNSGVGLALESSSCEESHVLEQIMDQVAYGLGIDSVFTWDIARGFRRVAYTEGSGIELMPHGLSNWDKGTMYDALRFIQEGYDGRGIFILLDFHKLMGDITLQRMLKGTCDALYSQEDNSQIKRLILLGENLELPQDFDGRIAKVTLPLPTPKEIRQELLLQAQVFQTRTDDFQVPSTEEVWLQIVRAASGLSRREFINIVREVAGACNEIGIETATRLHDYKVQKLKELGVEVALPPDTEIGGMDHLKQFIRARSKLLTQSQGDTPPIKGILAVGHPGTGKSLLAKSAGQILGVPVFKLQMDALLGSLVGESEQRTRKILDIASAAAPIVLWLDEIEKMFAGMSGDAHVGDSGVGRRVLGSILTWMAENQQPVFVVATANDVSQLPPELLRKGRFDEIFRVDLPTTAERQEIAQIHLNRWGTATSPESCEQLAQLVAESTPRFSGAEIAAIVQSAAIEAIAADRPGTILETDLTAICNSTQPLADQIPKDKHQQLEATWSRFRPASSQNRDEPTTRLGRSTVSAIRRK